ncbi:dTDP-4-dehydrorhamnose reductase family protein [Cohnella luojiensis]|uniref:dTDP-4-dehydrorhamnose reductase n=1 Tax=Cohnella luojiensis TaxID=652876 RepID=A0A4Y8M194_9BACL|nr:SDR family oxidoreductase [Cohnella luojiensis]TFE27849.1 SDR family oxidoreductase [Cohnella luojiensis]
MKVLLLGGNGMAGRLIATYMGRYTRHKMTVTVRKAEQAASTNGWPALEELGIRVRELDVRQFAEVAAAVSETSPDIIINTAGVLNHRAEDDPLDAYMVNGLLPHWLRHLGDRENSRLLHISSDCVFSGSRGNYREDDEPDGKTVYALSKALGEVRDPRHLTIRTSIIGPDVKPHGIGLMQWFLTRQGEVKGFRNVLWNGVTTLELAKTVVWLLDHPKAGGLIHLTASEKISKHDLLHLMKETFDKNDVTIVPDDEPVIDRTLAVTRDDVNYKRQSYPAMLTQLRQWLRES